MLALVAAGPQRIDRLRVEAEAVFLHGQADALHPGHLAEALRQFGVVGAEQLDAVAALLLGHVAGHVGAAQRLLHRLQPGGDMHHADAGGDLERAAVPDEMQALHRLPQVLGDLPGDLRRAVLQQDAELVAAQPRQGVVVA
ncbi:hypothetical protein D3C81_1221790 [compost metagenome]